MSLAIPERPGAYSAVNTIYDKVGRAIKQSNPTETNSAWLPSGDDESGWFYTQQTYDWKGRPLKTTNQDGTTKQASYSGCGCAGGEVVTLTDEGTLINGMANRRQQRIYSDVLGRTVKAEILNWEGSGPGGVGRSVYSTSINNYNARDQVIRSRQFDTSQGTVPSDPNDLSCPTGSCQQTTTTYDGYGRLKTQHMPEQDEGTATTWNYNADDTLQSTTDARGANTTYTYNARRLQIGVSYSAPAGIAATPPASFTYDAARNRTSMVDGLGSVTYVYDQLSRLTSETRSFNGVGPFPITYGYNLADQLISLTDTFGAQVGYGHDTAGRVTTVTGSGFGNVSNYATNLQYRASGELKHLTYGNGRALDANYDVRLNPLSFTVSGVISMNYQRFADGRLDYANDLLDQKFDRAYRYDHVGQLTQALSGAEARNQAATDDRPYKQDFGFDVWGNMTSRVGKHWSRSLINYGSTFVNGRVEGGVYDAEGLLLQSYSQTHVYDAAQQMIQTVETVNHRGGTSSFTVTEQFDGDGSLVKVSSNTQPQTYYLNSTVLGGTRIAELNAQGQKQVGYVYSNGQLLAKQNTYLGVAFYQHSEPHNLKQGQSGTYPDGTVVSELTEEDPLGGDAGRTDPYLDQNGDGVIDGPTNPNRPFFGDSGDLSRGCTQNDNPVDCFWLLYVMGKVNVTDYGFRAGSTRTLFDRSQVWHPGHKVEVKESNQLRPVYDAKGNPVMENGEQVYAADTKTVETRGFWTWESLPQNTVTEDDPNTITGTTNSKNCGISVNFTPGTTYPNTKLPNGPSIAPDPKTGHPSLGLGFTVTGWVSKGGIGTIGANHTPNPQNPKGVWTIDEETNAWISDGNKSVYVPTFTDISPGVPNQTAGNGFTWYDHPGNTVWPSNYHRYENHIVKVYNGKEYCEASFHFKQDGGTIHWGARLLK